MRKFIVNLNGNQYEVEVEEVGCEAQAPVAVAAPVAAPKANVKGTEMNAPMPGMIKSYAVAEGATVKKGQVVLVLEAMKMDNDMTAPCDGKISFKKAVGSNVETGELMAIIG